MGGQPNEDDMFSWRADKRLKAPGLWCRLYLPIGVSPLTRTALCDFFTVLAYHAGNDDDDESTATANHHQGDPHHKRIRSHLPRFGRQCDVVR